ncbi:hypothetical protein Q9L42_014985 [Methylomarinum sp. Ch1-1]|uniref:Transposase n=1 Tax=Methylomarinum roseum TaxID=3067653 RepID=A0AAU7NRS1_9GAMM|nr:hypothetical protein [Methylomarinum sp. Ch1-1]MDP4520372.1 hypothetical protein [Methylomarinum sp. Ch1-1]
MLKQRHCLGKSTLFLTWMEETLDDFITYPGFNAIASYRTQLSNEILPI